MSNKSRDISQIKTKYKPYEIPDFGSSPKYDDNYMRFSMARMSTNTSESKRRKPISKSGRESFSKYYTSESIPRSLADKLAGVLETSSQPISKNAKRNSNSNSIQIPERSSTISPGDSMSKNKSTNGSSVKKTGSQESFKTPEGPNNQIGKLEFNRKLM
jgi:hypothetical protein